MFIDGLLQVIDIKKEEYFECSPADLLQRYAINVIAAKDNETQIAFQPETVKVRDWTGWTDLNYIQAFHIPEKSTVISLQSGNNHIEINEDPILLYKKKFSKRVFHGEIQYMCYTDYPLMINRYNNDTSNLLGDEYWIRNIDIDGQFLHVHNSKSTSLSIEISARENTMQYNIDTRSGFFNVSGFHMASNSKLETIRTANPPIYK